MKKEKKYLFGDCVIRDIYKESDYRLRIKGVYAEYVDQEICFFNVLFTQLDRTLKGSRVAVTLEIPCENLDSIFYQNVVKEIIAPEKETTKDIVSYLQQHEYRVFTSFVDSGGEYITIAKEVEIN